MQKKNILFIIPWLPYPMISGGHQALFNGIAAVKDDFNVFLTYEAWNTEEYKKAEKGFLQKIPNVNLLPLIYELPTPESAKKRLIGKLKMCVKKVLGIKPPVFVEDKKANILAWWKATIIPSNKSWIEHICRITSEQHFDIIQVEMPWLVSFVFALPSYAKKIYVHHELGFVRREQEISQMGDREKYAAVLKAFADMNEINQLNLYDGIITLSSCDAKKLVAAGVKKPTYTSFAIIDTPEKFNPIVGDGKRLTFIGPDIHNPNFIGISWFLDNCWSMLKEKDPEITLDIIGKWSEENILKFSAKYSDVKFLGFVDDLNAAIQGSTMIVPITIGSGIRMKILEAASNGVPFVSTTIGAEGIPVVDGKHCFLTDDPIKFVESIIKLKDVILRQQFIANSYNMVKENYSIDALEKNRNHIYDIVLNAL